MKAIIIEDLIPHKELLKNGLISTNFEFDIIDLNISDILSSFEKGDLIGLIGVDIDLFIIDVGLRGGQDELGLKILQFLQEKYHNNNFKYIVTSIWDRSEFETTITIPDECFIDKNNFMGGELIYETKCKVTNLFKN